MNVNRILCGQKPDTYRSDELQQRVIYEIVESGTFAGYIGRYAMLSPAGCEGRHDVVGLDGRFVCTSGHEDFRFTPLPVGAVLQIEQINIHKPI